MTTVSPGKESEKSDAFSYPLSSLTRSRLPGKKTEVISEQLLILQSTGGILITNLGSVMKPIEYAVTYKLTSCGSASNAYSTLNAPVPAITGIFVIVDVDVSRGT
jgi:hypothetical protein